MKYTTGECDKRMLPKDQVASPSTDEGSFGGSLAGGGSGLKKGPWTSAEDATLVEYVKKHGEGNWNAVQKYSGLSRCGKSCRLRWANHLRPNLKKGAFTKEEEQLIIELHAKMGNKWARMASRLPGRTDNEIKNYWNTRIKRRQRAGLPVYPAHLSIPAINENQKGQNIGEFSSTNKMLSESLRGSDYCLPSILFDNYKASAGSLSYAPALPGYCFNSISRHGFEYPSYSFINPLLDRKQLGASETLLSLCPDGVGSELPLIENYPDDITCERIDSTFGGSYPYDPDPTSKNLAPYGSGSHALVNNGNFSSSRLYPGTVKQELPSLQYNTETASRCWFPYPLSPPTEAVDSYLQSHPPVSVQSTYCSSRRNSGLLEEVLQESRALHGGKKADSFCSDAACVDCDPISPLGGSAASVFNDYNPPISASSDFMLLAAEIGSTGNTVDMDIKPKSEFLRPDALLGGLWFLESSQTAKDFTDMEKFLE